MNPDPDYSAAYVILRTNRYDVAGHGFAFTIGKCNDVCVAATETLAPHVEGLRAEAMFEDMGTFARSLTGISQLRWLGPEKGVMHMATAAVINAAWDLYAKVRGVPLWKLLAEMSPEEIVALVDFRYLTDALTPDDALAILRSDEPTRAEREQELLGSGYPAYTTSAGWLGYRDDQLRRLSQRPGYAQILPGSARGLQLPRRRGLGDGVSERVALVTGASRGIGRAIADRLAADGWRVETAERSSGVDLADVDAARAAVERLDRIDALVANAGTAVRKPALEQSVEEWERVIRVNLTSVFVLAQAAARRMVGADGGGIVLIASMTSFVGGTNVAPYAASKGGVAQLTKALSNELAGRGVRVNAIAPGFVVTDLTADMDEPRRSAADARIPMGRWGTPEDVAGPVAWLLSDDSRYVTGAVIPVDGGFLAN
jgi:NAD(P)-dependent dehydrogenase (short-subunit alcohol dehydrogenase family)